MLCFLGLGKSKYCSRFGIFVRLFLRALRSGLLIINDMLFFLMDFKKGSGSGVLGFVTFENTFGLITVKGPS